MQQLTSLLMYSLYAPTWTARKLDKKVTEQAKQINGVKDGVDAGNFNKLILPDCDELKAVAAHITGTRQWFYLRTAPWGEARGVRVGKAEDHMEFMVEFGDRKAALVPLLAAFCTVYPSKVAEMEFELNSMFNAQDYPAVDVVRSKFDLRISVQPLPNANDVRVLTDIPAHIRQEIEDELKAEFEAAHRQSVEYAFNELLAPVKHMAVQLKRYHEGEAKKIYDSLITNVREMATAAKRLNIARDPAIDQLADEAATIVEGVTKKDLKESDGFRVTTQRRPRHWPRASPRSCPTTCEAQPAAAGGSGGPAQRADPVRVEDGARAS
jgi:hypothetical protein